MNTLTAPKKTTSLRIDNELFAYIEKKAKQSNRSINNYIETILWNSTGFNDFPVSAEEMRKIEKGREQFRNGETTPSSTVRKKALEICTK
ncbi:MAG: hypothetical protein KGV44_05075 [Flavobacteriaceae bacterium]|nr:hypothetical protein [Flavobacteriaceae bacterium]